jgi:hypothetical protein
VVGFISKWRVVLAAEAARDVFGLQDALQFR